MFEAGRPTLESLKTKWEWILSWCKSTALIYHRLTLSEHISRFIIFHSEVSVAWCFDILWSMVVAVILLRFHVRYNNIIGWMVKQLIWGNCCDGIIWWWSARLRMWVRSRSVKLCRVNPFYTLISSEFQGNSWSPIYDGTNVDKNLSVDCIPGKVEVFISLNKEIGH